MTNKEKLISAIEKNMLLELKLPHQATLIANDIFLLLYVHKEPKTGRLNDAFLEFKERLEKSKLTDLVERQAAYATRLARSKRNLSYEEMHKLFSLRDDVFALEYIGFKLNDLDKVDLESSIKYRFSLENKKAKLVAQDNFEPWKESLWWYIENN